MWDGVVGVRYLLVVGGVWCVAVDAGRCLISGGDLMLALVGGCIWLALISYFLVVGCRFGLVVYDMCYANGLEY